MIDTEMDECDAYVPPKFAASSSYSSVTLTSENIPHKFVFLINWYHYYRQYIYTGCLFLKCVY